MTAVATVTRAKASNPIAKAMKALTKRSVLVGIPGSAMREPAPGEKGPPVSNALVGYMMETGDDAMNLPPRPFLVPGVTNAKTEVVAGFTTAIRAAFHGDVGGIDKGLDRAGLAAQASVKLKILEGPFAPLSDRTIKARARRRYKDTGALVGSVANRNARDFLKLRGQGTPDAVLHDAGFAKPLFDTGSLYTSVQYIIRGSGS